MFPLLEIQAQPLHDTLVKIPAGSSLTETGVKIMMSGPTSNDGAGSSQKIPIALALQLHYRENRP